MTGLRLRQLANQQFDEACTAVLVDTQYDEDTPHDDDLTLECLTDDGMVYKVPKANRQFIRDEFSGKGFKSADTEFILGPNAKLDASTGNLLLQGPPGLRKKKNNRSLAVVTGQKSILVVRVVAA